jgi:hypothetical protein
MMARPGSRLVLEQVAHRGHSDSSQEALMAESYKLLGSGALGATATTLYTVPAATQAIIKLITLKSAADGQTAVVDAGASAPVIGNCLLNNGEWADWEGSLTLGAAGVVRGLATTASQVTAAVFGLEIT